MATDPMLLDPGRHAEALERLSLSALAAGDAAAALRFADRRCRIAPLAQAHHYTLRAEAAHQFGDTEAAVADTARALALAPDDPAANRRMLAWGHGAQRLAAARRLLAHDRDFGIVAKAIAALAEAGQRTFATVAPTDATISGWAVWTGTATVKVRIANADGEFEQEIAGDPDHQLAEHAEHAASFTLDRPRSRLPQQVTIRSGRRTLLAMQIPANARGDSSAMQGLGAGAPKDDAVEVTVIVPVYRGYDATLACLDRLAAELDAHTGARAIVVNDASPEAPIRNHLRNIAKRPSFTVLTNQHNLGFVGAVNRALEQAPRGDIILLNADTLPPSGFIARLAAAAHAAPDIGTVTPLSNNGEFTSLPVPFKSNPLGGMDEVAARDAAAQAANSTPVDIPNGIGFCLYITRACRESVGPLSGLYHLGYMEDVDFCLRARELGFRSVCAPGVYVGHAGSRSFGDEKRALVVRNLGPLESRFPEYRNECAAFMLADPLRPHRAAIERRLPQRGVTLLVTGAGTLRPVADARAEHLQAERRAALVMETRIEAAGPRVAFIAPGQAMPQSLSFDLSVSEQIAELRDYLDQLQLERIEIVDPTGAPEEVCERLLALDVPLDLLIADGGLYCPRGTFQQDGGKPCAALTSDRTCPGCTVPFDRGEISAEAWRASWRKIALGAGNVLAPCARAKDFALQFLTPGPVTELRPVATPIAPPTERPLGREAMLGIVPIGNSAIDFRSLRNIIRALRRQAPALGLVVLGSTIDDLGLIKAGGVFVTGDMEREEQRIVLRHYDVTALFVAARRPLFGHPTMTDFAAAGLPIALFDWSMGRVAAEQSDLALDPLSPDDAVAAALASWLGRM